VTLGALTNLPMVWAEQRTDFEARTREGRATENRNKAPDSTDRHTGAA
jgi:hypothetical protein